MFDIHVKCGGKETMNKDKRNPNDKPNANVHTALRSIGERDPKFNKKMFSRISCCNEFIVKKTHYQLVHLTMEHNFYSSF